MTIPFAFACFAPLLLFYHITFGQFLYLSSSWNNSGQIHDGGLGSNTQWLHHQHLLHPIQRACRRPLKFSASFAAHWCAYHGALCAFVCQPVLQPIKILLQGFLALSPFAAFSLILPYLLLFADAQTPTTLTPQHWLQAQPTAVALASVTAVAVILLYISTRILQWYRAATPIRRKRKLPTQIRKCKAKPRRGLLCELIACAGSTFIHFRKLRYRRDRRKHPKQNCKAKPRRPTHPQSANITRGTPRFRIPATLQIRHFREALQERCFVKD